MSDEMYAGLNAIRHLGKQEKKQRRAKAEADLPLAIEEANVAGLTLTRFTELHYRLFHPEGYWDVYPGNMRIIGKPWLKLPREWGLLDVVAAAKHLGAKP